MHVPMEMLKAAAGFRMTHIPYTGAGPAVLALLGGQVDARGHRAVQRGAADQGRQAARAGALGRQAAGVAARGAQPEAAGQPVQLCAVVGAVRAGGHARRRSCRSCAPPPRKAAADPAVVQTINRAGSPIEYLDAPEFQAYWDADAKLMTEAVRRIGKVE